MRHAAILTASLVLALVVTPVFAGPRQHGEGCAKDNDCDVGLMCRAYKCVTPGEWEAAKGKAAQKVGARRKAAADSKCRHSSSCTDWGKCSASASGACIATSNADCKASRHCRENDYCAWSKLGNSCRTAGASDTECRKHNRCYDFGWCTSRHGACVAGKDSDCRESKGCKENGSCAAGPEGRCVWTSDADCAASEVCEKYGWCRLVRMPAGHKACQK